MKCKPTHTQKQTYTHTEATHRLTDTQTETQSDWQTHSQTDRQTDRHTYKHTDTQTHMSITCDWKEFPKEGSDPLTS